MDKLEAIKWLKSIKDKYIHGGDESYDSRRTEAIDYAIAALSETVKTNADRIRAMSDEELATQLVQVFKEGIKVLTDMDMPEELLDKIWNSFLERLKQLAVE